MVPPDLVGCRPPDTCPKGKKYGDVLVPPERSYRKGQTAQVDFVGAHPNNRIRRNSTYTKVEQKKGGSWVCVYDDSDYETMFHWERPKDSKTESITRVIWNIPTWQEAGTYRLVQLGESRDRGERSRPT
ncbi:MAG: neutral/alkaline non-lysosomal ceramidase C-terminal domain-containing protein [Lawsonella clevelandensis]